MKNVILFMFLSCFYYGSISFGGPNLVINGDFEAGNISFNTAYQYYNGTLLYEGHYAIGPNPHDFHSFAASYGDHSSGNGNMMVVNGALIPNVTLWEQDVSVSPNTYYTFSIWFSSWIPVIQNVANLEFYINNTLVGSSIVDNYASWDHFSASWQSDLNTMAIIRVIDIETESYTNDFAIDDISLSVIPAPGAIILGSIGAGIVGWLRRRRAI
jgi:hypothetical protein